MILSRSVNVVLRAERRRVVPRVSDRKNPNDDYPPAVDTLNRATWIPQEALAGAVGEESNGVTGVGKAGFQRVVSSATCRS